MASSDSRIKLLVSTSTSKIYRGFRLPVGERGVMLVQYFDLCNHLLNNCRQSPYHQSLDKMYQVFVVPQNEWPYRIHHVTCVVKAKQNYVSCTLSVDGKRNDDSMKFFRFVQQFTSWLNVCHQ